MSADLLREAAALMRSRAEAATVGPWSVRGDDAHDMWVASGDVIGSPLFWSPDDGVRGGGESSDAVHIASWDPVVALAVADWLYASADEPWCCDECKFSPDNQNTAIRALAVARAYLGGSS